MYIQLYFPSGKYYAAEAHDPSLPEWPPHPSRLFSALVASAYRSRFGMTEEKREALEWMESLPPPFIAQPNADISPAPVVYVPPGDSQGRKGKVGEESYEHGIHRLKQPRHFPSAIILGDPIVYYGWKVEPEDDFMKTLDAIATDVTHVGTSHSIAVVKFNHGSMKASIKLTPGLNGSYFLHTPVEGRLEELDRIYQQIDGVRRPQSSYEPLTSYSSLKERPLEKTDFATDFMTFRISGSMHGADSSFYLGRAIRRAVMSALGDNAPSVVHGHNNDQHVGWLPLPDVGHPYARGRIVGVGIMLPRDLGSNQRREVLSGLRMVKKIHLPDGRIVNLNFPSPDERLPLALLSNTWTQHSKTWATVTPVVLDRPPKKFQEERVKKAISESLVFAGYPEPKYIEISSFSFFEGSPPAFRISIKKPKYHAIVQFNNLVAGPVIAGRLRYFGIGLFRPIA